MENEDEKRLSAEEVLEGLLDSCMNVVTLRDGSTIRVLSDERDYEALFSGAAQFVSLLCGLGIDIGNGSIGRICSAAKECNYFNSGSPFEVSIRRKM